MPESVSLEVTGKLVYGNGERILTPQESTVLSPPDPENFCFEMHVWMGAAGVTGVDAFDLKVCSPAWFADHVASGAWERFGAWPRPSIVTGTGIWFMRRWDRQEFEAGLADICRELSPGPNYGAVADRLSRYMPWEFEYRFDERVNRGEAWPQ